MNANWRYVVAGLLLVFAWKGSTLTIPWPPADGGGTVVIPQPEAEAAEWAKPVRAITPRMLAGDREYLASFYDAMSFVLRRDSERSQPIIDSTDKFVAFHAGSLQLAIDKQNVGKYPGLGEAIDLVIVNAIGADQRRLTAEDREKLVSACSALAFAFKVGRDG